METSRNVILDLLPLYHTNELSEESRALVEKHLENAPQIARLPIRTPQHKNRTCTMLAYQFSNKRTDTLRTTV